MSTFTTTQQTTAKKPRKPFQLRAKLGFAPITLSNYKTRAEAERAIPFFEARNYYKDIEIVDILAS